MFTTGPNAFVQKFAKVVDNFVDRCLRQVIPDLLQCTFSALRWSLALGEVCEMSEALHPTRGSQVG